MADSAVQALAENITGRFPHITVFTQDEVRRRYSLGWGVAQLLLHGHVVPSGVTVSGIEAMEQLAEFLAVDIPHNDRSTAAKPFIL